MLSVPSLMHLHACEARLFLIRARELTTCLIVPEDVVHLLNFRAASLCKVLLLSLSEALLVAGKILLSWHFIRERSLIFIPHLVDPIWIVVKLN